MQKVLSGVEDKISDPEVVGVIRSYESPNTEKDVLIVKEEQDIYHVVISIVNTGEGADHVTPIIEQVKEIEVEVFEEFFVSQ